MTIPNTSNLPTVLPITIVVTSTVQETPTEKSVGNSLDCNIENMKNKSLAVVNASPDGLRLRASEDGAEMAIIPHKSTVFVLGYGSEWSYIAWLSPSGLICGYSATRYLDT
jgi:hypothetical protein